MMNKRIQADDRQCISLILFSRHAGLSEGKCVPSALLSWREKYFLIRVMHLYGLDVLVAESTDILVPTMGMSYSHICSVQIRLESLGLLTLELVYEGRGRPLKGFTIHKDHLLQYLGSEEAQDVEAHHCCLVESLLCWGELDEDACLDLGEGAYVRSKRAYLKDDNHELDGKSRLFLSTLLVHSDEFGFVDSLGHRDIALLVGMTNDQQRAHVKKLQKAGYIRSVIKGFTNPRIFGRVQTTYCLNMAINGIAPDQAMKVLLLSNTVVRQAHEYSEATQLNRIALPYLIGQKSIEHPKLVHIRSFVDESDQCINLEDFSLKALSVLRDRTISNYVQYRLETYAAWFLNVPGFTGHKDSLTNSSYEDLQQKISIDVSAGGCINSEITGIFTRIALGMAYSYYQLLSTYCPDDQKYPDARFRVFPRLSSVGPFGGLYFSITALLAESQESPDVNNVSYIHIRDKRVEINRSRQQLLKQRTDNNEESEVLKLKIKALESEPEISCITYTSEESIDEGLKRNCGLRS